MHLVLVSCLGGLPRKSVISITDRAQNDLKCVEGPLNRNQTKPKTVILMLFTGGVTRTLAIETDTEFTFELFMCLALLQQCRSALMRCYDPAQVFHCINK